MSFVNKMNVSGTDYDIQDKRLAESDGTVTLNKNLIVTGSINGVSNPSVKPIYWHGIALYKDSGGGNIYDYITCHILKNDDVQFTIASLVAWAVAIPGEVTIQCGGFIKIDSDTYGVVALRKKSDNTWVFLYNNNGQLLTEGVTPATYFTNIDDDVNKIN